MNGDALHIGNTRRFRAMPTAELLAEQTRLERRLEALEMMAGKGELEFDETIAYLKAISEYKVRGERAQEAVSLLNDREREMNEIRAEIAVLGKVLDARQACPEQYRKPERTRLDDLIESLI